MTDREPSPNMMKSPSGACRALHRRCTSRAALPPLLSPLASCHGTATVRHPRRQFCQRCTAQPAPRVPAKIMTDDGARLSQMHTDRSARAQPGGQHGLRKQYSGRETAAGRD
jgi:hypothetical protein